MGDSTFDGVCSLRFMLAPIQGGVLKEESFYVFWLPIMFINPAPWFSFIYVCFTNVFMISYVYSCLSNVFMNEVTFVHVWPSGPHGLHHPAGGDSHPPKRARH